MHNLIYELIVNLGRLLEVIQVKSVCSAKP